VLKPRLQRIGIEDKVLVKQGNKFKLAMEGFAGVPCTIRVTRQMSNQGNLRSVMTDILPPKGANLGI
jgi:hypothetical protein